MNEGREVADRNGMPLRPFTPGFARGRWLQQACLPLTHTKKSSDPARNAFLKEFVFRAISGFLFPPNAPPLKIPSAREFRRPGNQQT
ncbi:hypothetical protein BGLA2_150039 [Burkholderia gladioli]|uniref:hypothetical protein n=1 Tax=Burkholderia gladioli TaxID=28095 RepID=UPI001CAC8C25|nr:hypothetical protein BGLA2_150039 [Burkholderia gladioli]